MALLNEIYATVLGGCRPMTVHSPLGHYVLDPVAYAAPQCPTELLATLLEKFPLDELVFAGAVLEGVAADQPPTLHPALVDSPILPIRTSLVGAPQELVVESGCLSAQHLPMVAAADDWRRCDSANHARTLFLAGSVADAAILMSLGFFATTARGLDQLSGNDLREACEAYGWRRHLAGPDGVAASASSRVVLVGWRPATCDPSPPAGYASVASHLVRLRHELRIRIPQIPCWTITRDVASRFAFVAKHGTPQELRAALRESVNQTWRPLFPDLVPKPNRQPTLGDVLLGNSERAIWGDAADDDQRQLAANSALDTAVVARLLDAASECQNPVDANVMVNLATFSRFFHHSANKLVWPAGRGKAPDAVASEADMGRQIDRLLRVSSHLLRLSEFIDRLDRTPLKSIKGPATR